MQGQRRGCSAKAGAKQAQSRHYGHGRCSPFLSQTDDFIRCLTRSKIPLGRPTAPGYTARIRQESAPGHRPRWCRRRRRGNPERSGKRTGSRPPHRPRAYLVGERRGWWHPVHRRSKPHAWKVRVNLSGKADNRAKRWRRRPPAFFCFALPIALCPLP